MFGFGFGLDVPMMKFGTMSSIGSPKASNDGTCGDPFALQQMLSDLGYYAGAIDGAIGSGTMTALRKFAESTGAPYDKGTFPKAATCQAVMDAWSAKMAPASPPSAPTTTSVATAPAKLMLNPAILKMLGIGKQTSVRSAQADVAPGSWWAAQTTTTKVAVVGGVVFALGATAYLVMGRKRATPNRRRGRRRHSRRS